MGNLEHALEYLKAGLCVLPVHPFSKRPCMSNWQKYITQRPTEEEVTKWFTALSGVGIGVVTGKISGLVVLDIDTRYEENVEALFDKYPTNLIARSGSGGYHLYYRYPDKVNHIPNAVNIIEGVDLRADGGFIVLPPTVHASGKAYEWIRYEGMLDFPIELLQQPKQSAPNQGKWLSEALRGVRSGERNNTAARLAGYFFSKGLNADVIEHILFEWNQRNDPPLPNNELSTTIKSIQRNHQEVCNTNITSVDFTDDRNRAPLVPAFDAVSLKDYFHQYAAEGVSWMVDEWLPKESITFLISPPEGYKTWVLLDLAVSIATGTPFLGHYEVNQTGAVLLIQQEDSHSGLAERLSIIMESKLDLLPHIEDGIIDVPILPDLPIYIHPNRMLKFDDVKIMNGLEELIQRIKPAVVLIDPLYSATSTENYMANTAEKMFRLKTFRDKYGCSFIIAHHSRKNVEPNSTAREDAWGSQFLNAFLETGWQMRRSNKIEPNEVIVRRHSKTMGNLRPIVLHFDISTQDELMYKVSVKDYVLSDGANVTGASADIIKLLSSKPMSQSEISQKLGKSKSTISRQMQKLKSDNVIQMLGDGKYTIVGNDEDEGDISL